MLTNKEEKRRKKVVGKKDINIDDYDIVTKPAFAHKIETEINAIDISNENPIEIDLTGDKQKEAACGKFLNLRDEPKIFYQEDYDKVTEPLNKLNINPVQLKINEKENETNVIDISKEERIVIDQTGEQSSEIINKIDLLEDQIAYLPFNKAQINVKIQNPIYKDLNDIQNIDLKKYNFIQEQSDFDLDDVFFNKNSEKRRLQSTNLSPGYCSNAKNVSKFELSLIADNSRHSSIEFSADKIISDIAYARFHNRSGKFRSNNKLSLKKYCSNK